MRVEKRRTRVGADFWRGTAMKSIRAVALIVVLVAAAPWAAAQGPVSEYYLTAGDQRMVHVVQGNSVLRS
ncbi:MAG: hypothetical protein C4547_07685 [Phycisphaerales bacterium]|nr:MAG: hypothetical protein C4547_07685 [Phycisphaerales bacterium]